jgi:hypothetical protein
MMKFRRRRHVQVPGVLIVAVIAILFFVLILSLFFGSSPSSQAKEVAEVFYKYEQKGDFGNSWELFHPQMKDKFSKSSYIQDRNHVFVGHFGTDTFTYTIGDPEHHKKWSMSKGADELKEVYQVPITQTYKSKFGTFTIHQEIFVAKADGEWLILWDYQ